MASWPVSIADAKAFLRIQGTADDAQLQDFIDSAAAVAEFFVGDLTGGTYTEVHNGGDQVIYTRHTPVQSVTTLTEYVGSITYTLTNQPLGSSADAWGYTIDDADAGRIVRRTASGIAWRFAPGVGNVSITYTTGRSTVPAQVRLGTEIVVRHLWTTRRGAMPLSSMTDDATSNIPGLGFAVPNRAIELFETLPRMPVIG